MTVMPAGAAARRRNWSWPVVVVGALLFTAGVVIAGVGYAATSSPAGVVRAYFAALERGDAAQALAFGPLPDGPHTLLTSAVLAEQQRIAPIRDVAVLRTASHGSQASVRMRYRVAFAAGAQTVTDTVLLRHARGAWRLASAAVSTELEVTEAVQRATIVGAGIPAGDTLLFPGAVPVRFDTPYLALDPQSAVVTFAALPTTQVLPRVTAAGADAMRAAVARALQACLTGASAEQPRCPQPDERYLPGSIRGSVVNSAASDIAVSLEPDAAGVLYASGVVRARVHYRRLAFDNRMVGGVGVVRLPLRARAYATAPVTARSVVWEQASS